MEVLLEAPEGRSTKPFRQALMELVREHDEYMKGSGNINWAAFAEDLPGIHEETLRKAVRGRKQPSRALIEECARVLRVPPTHFVEYRLLVAQDALDWRKVGHEQALRNLEEWLGQ